MEITMILAANSGRARFFTRVENASQLEEIHDMVNEAARQRAADLETDRIGPKSAGKSVHNTTGAVPNNTYQPAQTPAEHQADKFARDICAYLLQSQSEGGYSKLVLVATPQFLGILRPLLDPQVHAVTQQEINKDYTQLTVNELREQIGMH